MLSKELEILKQIEELYSGDITEEAFLELCKGKETKLQAWREAFEEYPLYEVQKAINYFYVKKSSKTRPNIAQLTAILQENGVHKDVEVKHESVEPCLGLQYAMQDKEDGNIKWFIPDYLDVEQLIRQDKWGFVYNIYKPTIEEFHRCLELYCEEITGKKRRFYSDNEISDMTDEQKEALRQRCRNVINNFQLKKLN